LIRFVVEAQRSRQPITFFVVVSLFSILLKYTIWFCYCFYFFVTKLPSLLIHSSWLILILLLVLHQLVYRASVLLLLMSI